ncbi:uncharacterized protein LOC141866134 isoform X2 [Acropora palmata]
MSFVDRWDHILEYTIEFCAGDLRINNLVTNSEAVEFVPSTSVQEFQHKIHKSAQIRKTTQRNSVGRRGKPILPSGSETFTKMPLPRVRPQSTARADLNQAEKQALIVDVPLNVSLT